MDTFVKRRSSAPEGFFAAEAAGLRWLAEPGVIDVVAVKNVSDEALELERIDSARPTAAAARDFGAALARLHDCGAEGFGYCPSKHAWFGPLDDPFAVPTKVHDDFGTWWANDRLRPVFERARGTLGRHAHVVERAITVIEGGAFNAIGGNDHIEQPARVHGDLWSGNLMWSERSGESVRGVLIDPAAHGGHRLEDLAMLHLFGAPYLEEIYAGYNDAHPLPDGWESDIPAHQLFGLLAHVDIFGSTYNRSTVAAAEAICAKDPS